jgi:hypothetical protein
LERYVDEVMCESENKQKMTYFNHTLFKLAICITIVTRVLSHEIGYMIIDAAYELKMLSYVCTTHGCKPECGCGELHHPFHTT